MQQLRPKPNGAPPWASSSSDLGGPWMILPSTPATVPQLRQSLWSRKLAPFQYLLLSLLGPLRFPTMLAVEWPSAMPSLLTSTCSVVSARSASIFSILPCSLVPAELAPSSISSSPAAPHDHRAELLPAVRDVCAMDAMKTLCVLVSSSTAPAMPLVFGRRAVRQNCL